ncbi:ATP-dependent DNA helicase UvrD2 [Propionibacteriaceae bacterium Y1700]|uniref:ATP-dependent DNA helicase UvrD2 n=1 Tax=Microlunatus sp. Y1700 TaxID=3418487 RepID=UPI003DA73DEB
MPDPAELLSALDPEQRVVASTLTGPMAVLAGAGTGKTRAITHRIAYGVATGVYDPRQVLAVTFTTRAAGEMRHRLGVLGARGVQAKTFHAAALGQARHFWPRVHRTAFPSVLDNKMSLVAEAAGRLRVRVDTATLRDLTGEISWSKVSNVTPDGYARHASGRSVSGVDPDTVGKVFAGYEALKRDRDRVDFEDILLCTAALLAEHEEVAAEFRRTYRWLVVDEYQDVSPLQQALLDLWRGDRSDICVVGDPAQTIHTFAGARADHLIDFPRRHPEAQVVRLVRDYRSTPQVVKAANLVMSAAGSGPSASITLQAQRPAGPEVALVESADESAEARTVAAWLAGLAERGVEWREMAVLFRVNSQSPSFEAALADRGIPYLVRNAERFYDRAEVRQALLVIRTEARVTPTDGEAQSTLARLRGLLSGLGWSAEAPTGAGAVRERWESLAALIAVADDLVAADPSVDLAGISAELDRRAEAQQVPSAQGVTLGTLHSAKGLEWDAVALVGAHEGTLPFVLAQSPAEVAEERRLLYVGITRAREHLQISWSRSRNGGSKRNPSRFLDPLRPAETRNHGVGGARAPRTKQSRRTVQSATCRSCGMHLESAAERKLGRHTGCDPTYDEGLLETLREWRRQEAAEQKLPAYCIFTDATLTAVAEAEPTDERGLLKIHGLGRVKVDKYGEHVLAIVDNARSERSSEKDC